MYSSHSKWDPFKKMFREHVRCHVDTNVTCITDVPKLVSVFSRESRVQMANANCYSVVSGSVLWHVP